MPQPGRWVMCPWECPARSSRFLDGPASLHVCISRCCFYEQPARLGDFPGLGFLWRNGTSRVTKKGNKVFPSALITSFKNFTPRAERKASLPHRPTVVSSHLQVSFSNSTHLPQNGTGAEAGKSGGGGVCHRGSCARAPSSCKASKTYTLGVAPGQGLPFSRTPAVAVPWGPPAPQCGPSAPSSPNRLKAAAQGCSRVSAGPRRDRQGPGGCRGRGQGGLASVCHHRPSRLAAGGPPSTAPKAGAGCLHSWVWARGDLALAHPRPLPGTSSSCSQRSRHGGSVLSGAAGGTRVCRSPPQTWRPST